MVELYSYQKASEAINIWATRQLIKYELKFDSNLPSYIQLQNYISKKISAQPRKVSCSTVFRIPPEHEKGFKKLLNKIKLGENVNPYLSRRLYSADFVDGLLDSYDCYHFHLGEKKKGKFIKGTDYLALAIVTPCEVFFIDVQPHGVDTWHSPNILEIVNKERPELIDKFKVKLFKNTSPNITDVKDIITLRERGYNFAVTLKNGDLFMSAKFGQVTMSNQSDVKNPNMAGIHFLKMQYVVRSLYFKTNALLNDFKSANLCTINKIQLNEFKSDEDFNLTEFSVTITYMKNLKLDFFKVVINL